MLCTRFQGALREKEREDRGWGGQRGEERGRNRWGGEQRERETERETAKQVEQIVRCYVCIQRDKKRFGVSYSTCIHKLQWRPSCEVIFLGADSNLSRYLKQSARGLQHQLHNSICLYPAYMHTGTDLRACCWKETYQLFQIIANVFVQNKFVQPPRTILHTVEADPFSPDSS
jgi:hypothetical protein